MGSGDRGGAVQQGLAARLRSETHALHVRAERAGVMPAILEGRVTAALYCLLLRNLHDIYVQLESSLSQHAHDASVAPVVFPELFREAPLAQDLRVLYGEAWRTDIPRLPTTQRYVERLVVISAEQPVLLVAHAYVRYLGDLSGGQLLARVVRSLVPAGAASGTQFYEFGAARAVAELARRFRAGLDAIPVDAEAAAAIIGEAQWAFRAHAQLFEEIAASASEESAAPHPLV